MIMYRQPSQFNMLNTSCEGALYAVASSFVISVLFGPGIKSVHVLSCMS